MEQENINLREKSGKTPDAAANRPVSTILGKLVIGAFIMDTAIPFILYFVFSIAQSIVSPYPVGALPPDHSLTARLYRGGVSYASCLVMLVVIGLISVVIRNTIFKTSEPLDKERWDRFFFGNLVGYWVSLFLLAVLLNTLSASQHWLNDSAILGVKRRMQSSRSRKIVPTSVLASRLSMSFVSSVSCAIFFWYSALTV